MSIVQSILEQRRFLGSRTGKPLRLKRPTIQRLPDATERAYAADLVRIVKAVGEDIEELLIAQLDRLSELSRLRPDAERMDIFDISDIIEKVDDELELRLKNKHLRRTEELVERYRDQVNTKNRMEIAKQIRRSLGVDVLAPDPQINDMLKLWRSEQQRLITKMTREQIDDVGNIARRGIRAGDRPNVIAERIRKKTGITEKKARLIARDQTNKLNGALTKMRQENLGITRYVWRTSLDERVRPEHLEREGRTFRWDSPPFDGHPGEPINCRCTAEPFIPGMPEPRATPQATRRLEKLREERRAKEEARREARRAPTGVFSASPSDQRPQARAAAHVYDATDAWVSDHTSKDSFLLKTAAKEEFGLEGVPYSKKRHRVTAEQIREARKVVRDMYKRTQAEFKRRGIKTVKLYRGVDKKYTAAGAVESWTTDPGLAKDFGPDVIVEEVPVEKILTASGLPHWHNGGFGEEFEHLVMQ